MQQHGVRVSCASEFCLTRHLPRSALLCPVLCPTQPTDHSSRPRRPCPSIQAHLQQRPHLRHRCGHRRRGSRCGVGERLRGCSRRLRFARTRKEVLSWRQYSSSMLQAGNTSRRTAVRSGKGVHSLCRPRVSWNARTALQTTCLAPSVAKHTQGVLVDSPASKGMTPYSRTRHECPGATQYSVAGMRYAVIQ